MKLVPKLSAQESQPVDYGGWAGIPRSRSSATTKNHCPLSAIWRNRRDNNTNWGLCVQNSNWHGGHNASHSLHTDTKRPRAKFTTSEPGSKAFRWWNPPQSTGAPHPPPHPHPHPHTLMTLWDNWKLQPVSKGGLVTVQWLQHTTGTQWWRTWAEFLEKTSRINKWTYWCVSEREGERLLWKHMRVV